MKKIFVINAGSSSLKFQLLDMPQENSIISGIFEHIGAGTMQFKWTSYRQKESVILPLCTHQEAVDYLLTYIVEKQFVNSLDEIDGVGHRVVHGGELFTHAVCITDDVMQKIENLSFLAPSHNPVNIMGIKAFSHALPKSQQVAVFDTAFHHTLMPEYYTYPLPAVYRERYALRKYGFHGISHHYIGQQVAELMRAQGEWRDDLKVISCHLGNGASICAMRNGQSINTSMGLTPLAGLMMGTRSGDIDPSILPFLMKEEQLSIDDMTDILNKQSGLLAVSQISHDVRHIQEAYFNGDADAVLAISMFVNRIAQTIASSLIDLGGLDVLVFTAGIGENSVLIRQLVIEKLACLGLFVNSSANEQGQVFIHNEKSCAKIAVIPTNEEIMIAQETLAILSAI
ncbi:MULTISPECIES: acetate/propionate family kinase [unclassified Granulicatella]|uniref:acetate/propionate family kinase n=1 Tax=unclassified Granulicatella TaxID=2630493 RepID=UPI0010731D41|nr:MULTISPECIES: acetate kinase [unclassified Granulicatella]MBF0780282.1 acetate kinase [Granulicatella sp. 19428wC4_WM01]TFU95618.1 acetate kinase [Granulicatella sp. WM01]